jgi:hypothetical protein
MKKAAYLCSPFRNKGDKTRQDTRRKTLKYLKFFEVLKIS